MPKGNILSKSGTAAGKNVRVIRSRGKCNRPGKIVTLMDKGIVDRWTAVGASKGFVTDAEIAKYLISLHFESGPCDADKHLKPSEKPVCQSCHGQLTLYCISCRQFSPQVVSSQMLLEFSEDKADDALSTECPTYKEQDGHKDLSHGRLSANNVHLHIGEKKVRLCGTVNARQAKQKDDTYSSDTEDDNNDEMFDDENSDTEIDERKKDEGESEKEEKSGNSGDRVGKKNSKTGATPEAESETDNKEYFCTVCKEVVCGLQHHMAHLKSHDMLRYGKTGYKCIVCQTNFKTFYGLHKHMKIATSEQHCVKCDAFFSSGCEVSGHKRMHRMEARRYCSWCRVSFPSLDKDTFNKHMKSHGYKYWVKFGKTECLCPQCGKVFKGKYQLDQHMTSHRKDNPFPCTFPDCQKAFKNARNLRQHLTFHGEKKHQCEMCGSKFFRSAHLQLHMQKHTGKKYQCEECSRYYYTKTELKYHLEAVHKGVRKFSCNICNMRFYSKGMLKAHMVTHSNDKPFQCDQCPATFRRKAALEKHVLRHSCKKPLRCEDCGQLYSCQSSFRTHRKKHHSDSVYVCECGMTFNVRSSLDFHRKMYHGVYDQQNPVNEQTSQTSIASQQVIQNVIVVEEASQVHLGEQSGRMIAGEQLSQMNVGEQPRQMIGSEPSHQVRQMIEQPNQIHWSVAHVKAYGTTNVGGSNL